MPPGLIKTISPVWPPPGYAPKIRLIEEAQPRDQPPPPSLLKHQAGSRAIQIFTDSSGIDGQVRVAAVLYRHGWEIRVLRYYLGKLVEHTVFKVEAVGVLLALHLLDSEGHCEGDTMTMPLFNQRYSE